MSGLGGTPFDELFATLTVRMGILHTCDSAASQRDRVVWERADAGLDIVPLGFRSREMKAIGKLGHPWTATIYGASDLEVCERLAQLLGHLEPLLGPKSGQPSLGGPSDADHNPERLGYGVKPGKVGPRGGDGIAAGWACDVSITLFTKIIEEHRPLATIRAVAFDVSALTDSGAEQGVAHQGAS